MIIKTNLDPRLDLMVLVVNITEVANLKGGCFVFTLSPSMFVMIVVTLSAKTREWAITAKTPGSVLSGLRH